jgi:hypothetical protein
MSGQVDSVDIADQKEFQEMRRRAILSCVIGNFMELYDFTLYGC